MNDISKSFSDYLIGVDEEYKGHIRCNKVLNVDNKDFNIVEVYSDGLVIQAFALMRESTRQIIRDKLPIWQSYVQMAGKNVSVGPSCSIACRDGENLWTLYNASNKEQQRNDGYIKYKAARKRFFKRWNSAPIQAKAKLVKRTCWIAFSVICAYMALYIIQPLRSSAWTALPLDSSLIMLMGLAITLVLIAILFPAIDSITLPGGTQIKTSID